MDGVDEAGNSVNQAAPIGGSYFESYHSIRGENTAQIFKIGNFTDGDIGGGLSWGGLNSLESDYEDTVSYQRYLNKMNYGWIDDQGVFWWYSYYTSEAGTGGAGGNVYISKSQVYAYNGAYITDGSVNVDTNMNNKKNYQTVIYAQLGYDIKKIRELGTIDKVNARTADALLTELSSVNSTCRTINYDVYTKYQKIGIGSGAGATEVSNGTLFIVN